MKLADGGEVEIINTKSEMCLRWENDYEFFRVYLTPSEAIELASELVKHAMPEAKPDTETVSIM